SFFAESSQLAGRVRRNQSLFYGMPEHLTERGHDVTHRSLTELFIYFPSDQCSNVRSRYFIELLLSKCRLQVVFNHLFVETVGCELAMDLRVSTQPLSGPNRQRWFVWLWQFWDGRFYSHSRERQFMAFGSFYVSRKFLRRFFSRHSSPDQN